MNNTNRKYIAPKTEIAMLILKGLLPAAWEPKVGDEVWCRGKVIAGSLNGTPNGFIVELPDAAGSPAFHIDNLRPTAALRPCASGEAVEVPEKQTGAWWDHFAKLVDEYKACDSESARPWIWFELEQFVRGYADSATIECPECGHEVPALKAGNCYQEDARTAPAPEEETKVDLLDALAALWDEGAKAGDCRFTDYRDGVPITVSVTVGKTATELSQESQQPDAEPRKPKVSVAVTAQGFINTDALEYYVEQIRNLVPDEKRTAADSLWQAFYTALKGTREPAPETQYQPGSIKNATLTETIFRVRNAGLGAIADRLEELARTGYGSNMATDALYMVNDLKHTAIAFGAAKDDTKEQCRIAMHEAEDKLEKAIIFGHKPDAEPVGYVSDTIDFTDTCGIGYICLYPIKRQGFTKPVYDHPSPSAPVGEPVGYAIKWRESGTYSKPLATLEEARHWSNIGRIDTAEEIVPLYRHPAPTPKVETGAWGKRVKLKREPLKDEDRICIDFADGELAKTFHPDTARRLANAIYATLGEPAPATPVAVAPEGVVEELKQIGDELQSHVFTRRIRNLGSRISDIALAKLVTLPEPSEYVKQQCKMNSDCRIVLNFPANKSLDYAAALIEAAKEASNG